MTKVLLMRVTPEKVERSFSVCVERKREGNKKKLEIEIRLHVP